MSTADPRETAKRAAAEAAALLVEDGMAVGLGTGSTAAHFARALARRAPRIRCVATSVLIEELARSLRLPVEPFGAPDGLARLDLAVDGADLVAPDLWLVKGGGGAHVREKVVAAAADRFVVVVSTDKLAAAVRAPIPLEILAFGAASTLRRLGGMLGPIELRAGAPPSPDGGVIADYLGEVGDPVALAAALEADPGVAGHGLFPPIMVHEVLVGDDDGTVARLPATPS